MKVYNYDKITKEFLSENVARENPLERGKFLIPANATSEEPLEPKAGYAVCFEDGFWTYKVDNRGEEYYIDNQLVVFEIGDEITPEMSTEKFSPQELEEIENKEKIGEAKAYLESTDWIISKINEVLLEGGDTSPLLNQYSDQLSQRKISRQTINDIENNL